MQLKSVMTALALAVSVTSCSTVSKVVYRIDVPQGNYLEESKVSQLRVGMTKEQVQYLLGTSLVTDPFGSNTWYYVYLQQKGYEDPVQHTLVVNFNQQGIVTSFDLDKPLPTDESRSTNTNTVLNATAEEKSSWWKVWKSNKEAAGEAINTENTDVTDKAVEQAKESAEKAAESVKESTKNAQQDAQAVAEKVEQKVEEVKEATQQTTEGTEGETTEKSWWKFWK